MHSSSNLQVPTSATPHSQPPSPSIALPTLSSDLAPALSVQATLTSYRAKAGQLTREELKHAIALMRADRTSAMTNRTVAKAVKARDTGPSAEDILATLN